MTTIPFQILGTGNYLPRQIVHSNELDARWRRATGTAIRQVGVRQRHIAAPDESSSFMAAQAAERAKAYTWSFAAARLRRAYSDLTSRDRVECK